jgi:putative SOS response-associated peptidase YedK
MLERYTLTTKSTDLSSQLKIDVTQGYSPVYNGGPTKLLPVITHEHPDGFSFFYWGLPPEMTKNKPISKMLVNAELELLASKTTYKNALLNRRCMIPADGFYLWKQVSKKGHIPYRFILNNEKPFLIAGFWEEFDTESKSDMHTFSMITVPSIEEIIPFSEMMPAIIKEINVEDWLNPSTSETRLIEIISDQPDTDFGSYPVSSQINKLELNSPELIKPSKPMDQFGNFSLFD